MSCGNVLVWTDVKEQDWEIAYVTFIRFGLDAVTVHTTTATIVLPHDNLIALHMGIRFVEPEWEEED